jgi:prevent-host-death family protein
MRTRTQTALHVPVGTARAELAELINRVHYGEEPIILTKHGRTFAAIVDMDDLTVLSNAKDMGLYDHLRHARVREIQKYYRQHLLYLINARYRVT